jgi:hypothetical protein
LGDGRREELATTEAALSLLSQVDSKQM